jgi:hypothetical protein
VPCLTVVFICGVGGEEFTEVNWDQQAAVLHCFFQLDPSSVFDLSSPLAYVLANTLRHRTEKHRT